MSVFSCSCRALQKIPLPGNLTLPRWNRQKHYIPKRRAPGIVLRGLFSPGSSPGAISSFRVSAEVRAWAAVPSAYPSPDRPGLSGEARTAADGLGRPSAGRSGREDGPDVREGPTCAREEFSGSRDVCTWAGMEPSAGSRSNASSGEGDDGGRTPWDATCPGPCSKRGRG